MSDSYRTPRLLALGIVALFGLLVGGPMILAIRVPAITTTATAVLTLVGVLGTGVVTLIGFMLKHSIDGYAVQFQQASEKRLQLDSDNNRLLGKQAEDRLRLDTALRAVALLSTSSGAPADGSQKAGALFALASLGQIELALALLAKMWPTGEVDDDTAMVMLEKALRSEAAHQMNAVEIMLANVHRMTSSGESHIMPNGFGVSWDPTLCLWAREGLVEVVIRIILAIPREKWSIDYLRGAMGKLYLAMTHDPQIRIQGETALVLKELLDADIVHRVLFFPDGNVYLPEMRQRVEDVLARVEAEHPVDGFRDKILTLVDSVKTWRGAAPSAELEQGSLPSLRLTPTDLATTVVTVSKPGSEVER